MQSMSLLPSIGFFSAIFVYKNKQSIPRTAVLTRKMNRFLTDTKTSPHPSRSLNVCINGNRCWYTNFIYMAWNHWDEIRKTESIIQMFDVRQRLELICESPVYQKMVSTSALHLISNIWADFLLNRSFPKMTPQSQ